MRFFLFQWKHVLLLRHSDALCFSLVRSFFFESISLRWSRLLNLQYSLVLCPDIHQNIQAWVFELSFVWYRLSHFWFLSLELCIAFKLCSVHLCRTSSNYGKSHFCQSSSNQTRSILFPGIFSRVNLTYPLISLSSPIVSSASTFIFNFSKNSWTRFWICIWYNRQRSNALHMGRRYLIRFPKLRQ